MRLHIFIEFFIFLIFSTSNCLSQDMEVLLEWKNLEFIFPSEEIEQNAIKDGQYIHGNGALIDVDVQYKDIDNPRIFATVPRFSAGVPSSLNTVSNISGDDGPKLLPYPDYSWHSSHGSDCGGITCVFRIAIDKCNRLWVLDTGRVTNKQHCNPQLLVFSLSTDKLIHRYVFPSDMFTPSASNFITPIVDVRHGDCQNTMVYVADVKGFTVIVYSLRTNSSWKVENENFKAYDQYSNITIAGESFILSDGIFGMAITPNIDDLVDEPNFTEPPKRHLYFHAMASLNETKVPLSLLDSESSWTANESRNDNDFKIIGQRSTQSAAEAMDSKGNLYFGLLEDICIASWNIFSGEAYTTDNFKIVAQNDTTLQFPSGMKVKENEEKQEELWVVTNRFQKLSTGTKSNDEINFRILKCSTDKLQSGVGC